MKNYRHSIPWLVEALIRHSSIDELETPYERIIEALITAHEQMGTLFKITDIMRQFLSLAPHHELVKEMNLKFGVKYAAFKNCLKAVQKEPVEHKEKVLHGKVCRGEISLSDIEKSSLKCFYVTNTTAFVKIAPIKLEEANHNPYVVIFHEVLYDREIDEIKQISKKRVKYLENVLVLS